MCLCENGSWQYTWFLSHKKGISSVQLAKDINVTQKTAWFMLNRIRDNMKSDSNFDDTTQVDETYVGGRTPGNIKRNKDVACYRKPPSDGFVIRWQSPYRSHS